MRDHWHIVYDRRAPDAQAVGSVAHAHTGNHRGHRDPDTGRLLPWGRPLDADPFAARLARRGVIADDPPSGKVWVPRHLRDQVH